MKIFGWNFKNERRKKTKKNERRKTKKNERRKIDYTLVYNYFLESEMHLSCAIITFIYLYLSR